MDITILTMLTGLMFTCEASKCKVEFAIFTIYFSIKKIVTALFEQTLLYLYTVGLKILYITS